MARAAVFQKAQIAAETVAGTPVAANKRLHCTSFVPRPMEPQTPFRPVGTKYVTDLTQEKGWTEIDIAGVLSYLDIVYLLNGLIEKPTPAATWTFDGDSFGPDTLQSYSMEIGSAAGAEKFAYGIVDSLEIRLTLQEASIRGTMFGRKITELATLTPAPADIKKFPINPKTIEILVGDTIGGLAKITNAFEFTWAMRGKHRPFFTFDPAQDSFREPVELAPEHTATLVTEHNSVAAGYMTDLRNATQKFIRVKSVGPEFGMGTPYIFQLTFPFKFLESDRGEASDVWASTWNLMPDHETTFGKAVEFVITTDMATL